MATNQGLVKLQQDLAGYLEKRAEFVRAILPDGYKPERIIKTAIIACLENPQIAQCDPVSVFRSVAQAAKLGLELGGPAGEAYLIPYGAQCQMQASYKGWIKNARSRWVKRIHAAVVYENDDFDYSEAPKAVEHKPSLADRGEPIGAYCVAYDHEGNIFDATWVPIKELNKAQSLSKRSQAWEHWADEMRKKVAIKRLCKTLPMDTSGTKLLQIETGTDGGVTIDPDIDSIGEIIEAGALPELKEGRQKAPSAKKKENAAKIDSKPRKRGRPKGAKNKPREPLSEEPNAAGEDLEPPPQDEPPPDVEFSSTNNQGPVVIPRPKEDPDDLPWMKYDNPGGQ